VPPALALTSLRPVNNVGGKCTQGRFLRILFYYEFASETKGELGLVLVLLFLSVFSVKIRNFDAAK